MAVRADSDHIPFDAKELGVRVLSEIGSPGSFERTDLRRHVDCIRNRLSLDLGGHPHARSLALRRRWAVNSRLPDVLLRGVGCQRVLATANCPFVPPRL